jgi:hypothetical protein
MPVRLLCVLLAAAAAVYGYGALLLVILDLRDNPVWPAAAGSAGSLALIVLRLGHTPRSRAPSLARHPALLAAHLALATGLAAWALVGAVLAHQAWPTDVALAAGELICATVAVCVWPAALRLVRRW